MSAGQVKALWILALAFTTACLPGQRHGEGTPCDDLRPCRDFLSCSAAHICEARPIGFPSGGDAADVVPDAATANDAAAAPDVEGEDATRTVDLTCAETTAVIPRDPIRVGVHIRCHDDPKFCDLPRGVASWPSNVIPVCVWNGSRTDPQAVEQVRLAVMQSWGKDTSLKFLGWQPCACGAAGSIVVTIEAGEAARSFLGFAGTKAVEVVIGADSTKFHERVAFAFGRALGVIDSSNFSPVSGRDVLRAQRTYGVIPSGTLVGAGGRCLTAMNDNAVLSPCASSPETTWTFTSQGQLANGAPPYSCLTGSAGRSTFNLASCSNGLPRRFAITDAQWIAMGKFCVGAQFSASGAKLATRTCRDSDELSHWDFLPDKGAIRLSGTGLCVTKPADQNYGDRVYLETCALDDRQRFRFERGHILLDSEICLNVGDGYPYEGRELLLWFGCQDIFLDEDKLFALDGHLQTGDQCIDADGPIDDISLATTGTCGTESKRWRFRW